MTATLLEWVFTSVFLILMLLALRTVFGGRVGARLRYALWAVVLVRLLVPVQLFPFPFAGMQLFPGDRTAQNTSKVTDGSQERGGPDAVLALGGQDGPSATLSNFPPAPDAPTLPNAPAPPAPPDFTRAPAWLGWVWLGGSASMALVLAVTNLRFAHRLRRRRVPLEGIDCPLPVYAAVGLPSPCLYGLVRPAIYVTPEAAADPAMLRHVIAHEYTHSRHGDHLWNVLRCAALAVHWWNPLVWLAVELSRRDGELACDEGALERLGDGERLAYGNTLLALVTAKPGPGDLLCFATTMAGEKRSLKERIRRIACAPKRMLWAALAVVLVTALACVCAFGQAAAPDGPEDNPDPIRIECQAVAGTPAPGSEQQADLNRNGVPETLRVSGSSEKMLLEVWEDGKRIFSEEGRHSHAGYNAVFLCTLDGKDYLLRYNPYMGQGVCDYSYKLFTLSEDGEEQAVQEKHFEFSINLASPLVFGGPYDGSFDPEEIAAFVDEVNALLANSVQLINTDGDLLGTFQDRGRLVDDLWWLDIWEPVFIRDGSKSLLENLQAFQAAMVAPLVYGIDNDLLLAYQGKETRFDGVWKHLPDEIAFGTVIDLDGDGRDEIVAILDAGGGTSAMFTDLHIFDAETMGEYDYELDWITGQITSTGDKENFYLSAPGVGRVAIPKSVLQYGEPFDSIVFGLYQGYDIVDGKLFCRLYGHGGIDEICAAVTVELKLVDGEIRCGSFEIAAC